MASGVHKHTIHTNCLESPEHCELERRTLIQLLQLEVEFRELYEQFTTELQLQKDLIERIWILSQRYIILISTGPCCKYPQVYSAPAEEVLLKEYNTKLNEIRASNNRLMQELENLRLTIRVFENLHRQIDMTKETAFILGDTFHKPLNFFIELVDDLFTYLHCHFLKMKYRSHLLEPQDLKPIEEYKILLELNEDYEEYLMLGLSFCKCLKPKPTCGAHQL